MLKLSSLGTLKNRLPRLPKIAGLDAVESLPRKLPNELKIEEIPFEQKYAPYRPFNSSYEVYIWQWLITRGYQRSHQWRVQVTFGRKGSRGSTRVDFISDILGIAWYPDGAYFHAGETKTGADVMRRAQVAGRGYRVVQWLISSSDQLVRELPAFYTRMVTGRI